MAMLIVKQIFKIADWEKMTYLYKISVNFKKKL